MSLSKFKGWLKACLSILQTMYKFKKIIHKQINLTKRERTIFVDNDEHTAYAPVKFVVNTETLSHNSPDWAVNTEQLIVNGYITDVTIWRSEERRVAPRHGSSALHPLLTDGHSQIPTRHWHCGVLKTGQAQPSPHQLYGQSNGLIGNILPPTVL